MAKSSAPNRRVGSILDTSSTSGSVDRTTLMLARLPQPPGGPGGAEGSTAWLAARGGSRSDPVLARRLQRGSARARSQALPTRARTFGQAHHWASASG